MVLFAAMCLLVSTFISTTTAVSTKPDYLPDSKDYDVTNPNEEESRTASSNEVIDNRPIEYEQKMLFYEFAESELDEKSSTSGNGREKEIEGVDNQSPLDPWSIVWYIGSFGGLVTFFLIVSCSEWCCRKNARPINPPYDSRRDENSQTASSNVIETPPPPYHLFAPPPYDSVNYGESVDKASGEKLDIYVITLPIQATAQPAPT